MAAYGFEVACISDANAFDITRNVLTGIIDQQLYEVHGIHAQRSSSPVSKCMWYAIYCYPNGQRIPHELYKNALQTILKKRPINAKEHMSGYYRNENFEAVYILWKCTDCTCFFDVAGPQMNPPGGITIGLSDWTGDISLLQFQMAEYHVCIVEGPNTIPGTHSMELLMSGGTTTFHWMFHVNRTSSELYCVAATIGSVGLVLVGNNIEKLEIEILEFISYIKRDAQLLSMSISLDDSAQDDLELEMEENHGPPVSFLTLDETIASKLHTECARNLLDGFKRWAAQRYINREQKPVLYTLESPPSE